MVEVRIGLPLPMDVAGTLLKIIGKTYPGTVIKQDDQPNTRLAPDRQMILEIPDDERHNTPKSKKKYAKWKRELQAWDTDVAELGPDGISIVPYEQLAKQWGVMAEHAFNENPDAINYLESQVWVGPNLYVFHVAKSSKQTPHALRKAAEAENTSLKEQVAALTGALTMIAGSTNIRTARTIVNQALGVAQPDR